MNPAIPMYIAMRTCFKCSELGGKLRKSHAMHPSWYAVDREVAARVIYLCDPCYKPDRAAGRRQEAEFEDNSLYHLSWEELTDREDDEDDSCWFVFGPDWYYYHQEEDEFSLGAPVRTYVQPEKLKYPRATISEEEWDARSRFSRG